MQGEPIDVLGGRVAQVAIPGAEPTVKRDVVTETTQGAHEDMAVSGNETRRDEFAGGINRGRGGEVGRSLPFAQGGDTAIGADGEPTGKSGGLVGVNRDKRGIFDQQ